MWSRRKYELASGIDETRQQFSRAWQGWLRNNPLLTAFALVKLFQARRHARRASEPLQPLARLRSRKRKWWVAGVLGAGAVAAVLWWRKTRAGHSA